MSRSGDRGLWLSRRRSGAGFGLAGFGLMDIVFVLALLALFVLLSSHLWRATMLTSRDARLVEIDGPRLDLILDRMKRDAWGARSAIMLKDQGVRMAGAGEDRWVWWGVRDDNTFMRREYAEDELVSELAWPPFASRIALTPVPGGIEVTIAPKGGVPSAPVLIMMPGQRVFSVEGAPGA